MEKEFKKMRSLTCIVNENGKEVATLYQQHTGYLDGKNIKKIPLKVPKTSEGLLFYLLNHIEHFELVPPGTRNVGEECIYTFKFNLDKSLNLLVTRDDKVLFDGLAKDFMPS